ncbi:MAG TPA: hydantoinase/oxoprolinase family protein, partial [Solirubrobacteraceae bacterium]|nr:hydantoinase/oxoprolinase family protein [Solirubrobacteraceae bacterium]
LGIIRIANAEMARALRVVTVQRGIDPRDYALLPFGGAGPMHAAAVADELGIETVICPRASGVLAALGLVVSERRRDVQRSVFLSGDALTVDAVRAEVEALATRARSELEERSAELRVTYELRYRGQAFELAVQRPGVADPAELREAFADAHEERYGYRDPAGEVELVTIRVAAFIPGAEVRLEAPDEDAAPGAGSGRTTRTALFDDRRVQAEVWRGRIAAGAELTGPAVCELPEATLVVPPGWRGVADGAGTIVMRRERAGDDG